MSELNQDKKVIQDGRQNRLEDAEAPLRDQVVEKLRNKLIELQAGQKVQNLWHQGNANRTQWLERRKAYLALVDEHGINDSTGPWDGSSQLHIPMPLVVLKTLHARYFQAIWQDPPCMSKARNEASMERVPVVQDTMVYFLKDGANYNKGVRKQVDRWIWEVVGDGSGIMKWRWDCRYTRFVDVVTEMRPGAPQYSAGPNGETILVPTIEPVEVEKAITKKTFEGPVLDNVDLEDIVLSGGEGDPDLADAVIHRQFLTADELWTLVDRKVFDRDAVEEIIRAGEDSVDGGANNEIKTQAAQQAGMSQLSKGDLQRYEILEAWLRMDVDGSGINSDVVCWVHNRTAQMPRATYVHRINKTGERPFVKADYHLRKNAEYGTGILEMIYPLSKELDAMRNIRIDSGLISTMPFGFYRASSSLDPEVIRYEPGSLIPVDNPQTDVYFPNLGNRTSFGLQEEAGIDGMIQRLTGVNELSMGMMSSQGATRTATGARALVGEMSANLDIHLGRIQEGVKKAWRFLLHTLQQRIPPGLSFRVTGEDGQDYWRNIKGQADIAGDYDVVVDPNSAASNPSIMQERAQQTLMLVQNPLAIQLQIVTPANLYEAMKNVLQSMGLKDWGRFINKPAPVTRVLTPLEEANRVLRGIDVPVTPEGDHEGFIAWWQMAQKDDQILGQFSEEETIALARHAKKHEQMAQALQAIEAQRANSMQMRANASQSMEQTGQSAIPAAPAVGQ
jgi:hypothetical protein